MVRNLLLLSGNTQDVALRKYLQDNGFKTIENGGNITIIPAANADILTLFLKKEIDGAWVPEPWATRLVKEAMARYLWMKEIYGLRMESL